MQSIIQHDTVGTIVYEESFWSGKKTLMINNVPLVKQNKKTYLWTQDGVTKTVTLTGNFVTGAQLNVDGNSICITAPSKWYEIALAVMIFMMNIIWGNSVELCSIFPIVSGAIGGAVSGLIAFSYLLAAKYVKNIFLKLLIWLGMFIGMFVICFLLALALLPALM